MPSTSSVFSNLLSGIGGLGLQRTSLVSSATQAADCGHWLALRIAEDVTDQQLCELHDVWKQSGLLAITSLVVPGAISIENIAHDSWNHVLVEEVALSDARSSAVMGVGPMCYASTRVAEKFCTDFHGSVIGLSEWSAPNAVEPQFEARAEQQKSFIRCCKALIGSLSHEKISYISLWTQTRRVVTASRSAARNAGIAAGSAYEFCLPHSQRREGEQLLREGEKVRMWFPVGAAEIRRAVGG